MTTRTWKIEKFIPKVGSPVFQIHEELETNGQILQLGPRNPSPLELVDNNDKFNAEQQARITELEAAKTALETEKTNLEAEKTTLTAERDSLAAAKTQLESDVASLTDDLNIAASQLESVTVDRNALQSQLTTAQARIAELELALNPPTSPNEISPADFVARFTDDELVKIQTSVDPLVIRGRTRVQTITTFIHLDLDDTKNLVGYLAMIGLIAPDRVPVILSPKV